MARIVARAKGPAARVASKRTHTRRVIRVRTASEYARRLRDVAVVLGAAWSCDCDGDRDRTGLYGDYYSRADECWERTARPVSWRTNRPDALPSCREARDVLRPLQVPNSARDGKDSRR